MKKYERMAKEYVVKRPDYDEYYENDFCQNNYKDLNEAYIAGFKAAREMAAELSRNFIRSCHVDQKSKTMTIGAWADIAPSLEKLGEEECE